MKHVLVIEREDQRWCVIVSDDPFPLYESSQKDLAIEFGRNFIHNSDIRMEVIEDYRLSPYMSNSL